MKEPDVSHLQNCLVSGTLVLRANIGNTSFFALVCFALSCSHLKVVVVRLQLQARSAHSLHLLGKVQGCTWSFEAQPLASTNPN